MSESRVVQGPRVRFAAGIEVPGDKSLSHRALILAAMARGASQVERLAPGLDVTRTVAAIEALGCEIRWPTIDSPGIDYWAEPDEPLDCGNSGTSLRLLAGALSGASLTAVLTGDDSLQRRPMRRLVAPLESLGARLELSDAGTAPVTVTGASPTTSADVVIPIASAQVRSAFSLGALRADGPSSISSPTGFRDHTERWLETMGLGIKETPETFRILPGTVPPFHYVIPGDPSSAAYLWAAAAIIEGAAVVTPQVSLNPGRIGFLQVLESMGAVVSAEVTGAILGDPIGTVAVRGRGLQGVTVSGDLVAATLDELPLVAVVASYAEGITRVRDAGELRKKESDRIASTVEMIRNLGGGAEPRDDGFDVLGLGWLEEGTVDAVGDHRIAMAAAVAATAATGPVTIVGADTAAVSWPRFFEALEALWSSR